MTNATMWEKDNFSNYDNYPINFGEKKYPTNIEEKNI